MSYGRTDSSRPLPGFSAMADTQSVVTLIESTTSKIQQLQHAFAELESHRAVSLNMKWKELEEHFHGLEKSLKKRFYELEDQEKDYVTKVTEAQEMLEKREAVVVSKELTLLERLQEKRDAALSAIFGKQKSAPSEPIINGMSSGVPDSVVEENLDVKFTKSCSEDVNPAENGNVDAKPHSELMKLCEEMDAEGLQKFISDNRKNLSSIREEIPSALRSATNPFSLVLDSLKDFYSGEILGLDGKKDGNLLGLRRTCLMLMESLEQLQADSVLGSLSDNQTLTSEIRGRAKVIATEWEPKLDDLDIDASSGNSLEAHAFLQLLATFRIASEFDRDEICKLIPAVTRRRQAVDLCRSLGLSDKMPGVIEVLLNSGRQIEAVNLAYAFELTEQYAPVPLLKAYLKEARKVSQIKAGNMSPGAQNETNERELSALKAIMKCIEEHKLEEQYPTDPLQKRILQLEKAKADKRRAAEAAKPQSKRPRANGTTYVESLLRECKKEEAASVLDDDALNDLLARSESEIDVFESVDKQRREEEMAAWQRLIQGSSAEGLEPLLMPSRLVTDEDLKLFYEAIMRYESPNVNVKRQGEYLGGLDTHQYGRGKRAREVRSYEDQWTEEEFEKLCQVDSPESSQPAEVLKDPSPTNDSGGLKVSVQDVQSSSSKNPLGTSKESLHPCKETPPPAKRGRGRPKRGATSVTPSSAAPPSNIISKQETGPQGENLSASSTFAGVGPVSTEETPGNAQHEIGVGTTAFLPSPGPQMSVQAKRRKTQTGETPRGRGRKQKSVSSTAGAQANMVTGPPKGTEAANNTSAISAFAQESPTVDKSSGIANAPPLCHQVNPVSGLQNIVDVASGKASSSLQAPEKFKNILPAVDIRQSGRGIPAYDIKAASAGTKWTAGADSMSSMQSKMHDNVKGVMVQAGPGQMFVPFASVMPVPTQNLKDRKNNAGTDVASTEKKKPAEMQDEYSLLGTQKTVPDSDVKSTEKQGPTEKKDVSSLTSMQKTMASVDIKSSEKKKQVDKQEDSSIPSAQQMITRPDVKSCEKPKLVEKLHDTSLQNVLIVEPHSDALKTSPMSGASGDKATSGAEPPCLTPVEFIKCQENVNLDMAPGTLSESMKDGTVLVAAPLAQMQCSPIPNVIQKGPGNKASVTRRKTTAREPRSRSNSSTAACERRARLAGLKQLEGSRKTDSKGKSVKANTLREKQGTDDTKVSPVTSGTVSGLEEKSTKIQVPVTLSMPMEISSEKSELSKQCNRQSDICTINESAASLIGTTLAPAKSEIKLVQDNVHGTDEDIMKSSTPAVNEILRNITGSPSTNTKAGDVTSKASLMLSEAPESSAGGEIGTLLRDPGKSKLNNNADIKHESCKSRTAVDTREPMLPSSEPEALAIGNSVNHLVNLPSETAMPQLFTRNASQSCQGHSGSEVLKSDGKETLLGSEHVSSTEIFPVHPSSSVIPPGAELSEEKVMEAGEAPSGFSSGKPCAGPSHVSSEVEAKEEEKIVVVVEVPRVSAQVVQVTADARQSDNENPPSQSCTEMDCSVPPGSEVVSSCPEEAVIVDEEKISMDESCSQSPKTQTGEVPSLSVIEDVVRDEEPSSAVAETDTGSKPTCTQKEILTGSAAGDVCPASICTTAAFNDNISHSESIMTDRTFSASIASNVASKDEQTSEARITAEFPAGKQTECDPPASIPIGKQTECDPPAEMNPDCSANKCRFAMEAVAVAEINDDPISNCHTSATTLPETNICRATECALDEQENKCGLNEVAETASLATSQESEHPQNANDLAECTVVQLSDIPLSGQNDQLDQQVDLPANVSHRDNSCETKITEETVGGCATLNGDNASNLPSPTLKRDGEPTNKSSSDDLTPDGPGKEISGQLYVDPDSKDSGPTEVNCSEDHTLPCVTTAEMHD